MKEQLQKDFDNTIKNLTLSQKDIEIKKFYLYNFINKGFPNKREEDGKFSDLNQIIKKNIVVLIGPCLSFKNFEVSKDFKSRFINKNKKYSIFFKYKNKNKDLFNLRRLINYQFKELGIKNIYNINKDTFSNKKVFFSHRRESQKFRDTGRMLNIIAFND